MGWISVPNGAKLLPLEEGVVALRDVLAHLFAHDGR